MSVWFVFFFSSRRRHTRCLSDWSSDVCSSDLSQTAKQLEKELETQRRKGALSQIDELAGRVQVVKGIKVIAAEVRNVDREGLRQLVDSLRQKLGSGVVALGMPEDGKVALIAGVTKDLTAKVHAGKLMQALAPMGGG